MTEQQPQILKTNGWLVWLSLGFGILALGLSLTVSLYFYYHASAWQASFSASAQQQSDMKRTLKHQKQDINALNASVDTLSTQSKNATQVLTDVQTQISALQTQWSKPALAHVLYLAQLAQDALWYQFDNTQAILYLKEAHIELTQGNDAEFQTLDASVQQSLTALAAITAPNVPKIVTQLSELQDAVNALPLTQTESETVTRMQPDRKSSFWRNVGGSAWRGLQKVVTIKHYGNNAPHFITPDERAYFNARLCLYLNQAQWAALAHNSALFNSSMASAEHWLKTNYDTNNVAAQTLLQKMQALENMNLQPNFPALSPLISRLQQALLRGRK